MKTALGNLERFLHDSDGLDPLIVCALAHAQWETIHPFLDGNGRVGRLLITFLLCREKVLQRPVLYLSHHLKQSLAVTATACSGSLHTSTCSTMSSNPTRTGP